VLELVREESNGGFAWRVACVNDVAHLSDLVTEADAG
jgi:hypothetical protein